MIVLDASALLAYLQGEEGADIVESHLETGSVCPSVNWSEVAQKVRAAGGNWDLSRALLLSYGIDVTPVTVVDAESAAARWVRGAGHSIADRLCMSVADRLELPALTADSSWGSSERVQQIR